jgi:hypothetical protein
MIKKKVKFSLYRPWSPLGLQEVEAPTFSDIWLIDGGKVVSPTSRYLPPGKFLVLISIRGWVDSRAIVQPEGLGKLKKSTSRGTRTGNLPSCSIVPQPTTLLCAPCVNIFNCNKLRECSISTLYHVLLWREESLVANSKWVYFS